MSKVRYNIENRILVLDMLRGISMVFVIIYHFFYSLDYFMNIKLISLDMPIIGVIHRLILMILFIVSGVCTSFSRNLLKNGIKLVILGQVISIFTLIFVPSLAIRFGILSFIGTMMIISYFKTYIPNNINIILKLIILFSLYIVLLDFPSGVINLFGKKLEINLPDNINYLYPIGIVSKDFTSSDYFPIIPNGFIYLFGVVLSRPISDNSFPKWFYNIKGIPIINFIGKHSLIVYLIHQPIIIGCLWLFKSFL